MTCHAENAGRLRLPGARRSVSTFLIYLLSAAFDVEAERVGPERPAIVIVSGVIDVLGIECGEKTFEYARVVVSFPVIFRCVVQLPVADEEVESAAGEVLRVDGRNASDCELRSH